MHKKGSKCYILLFLLLVVQHLISSPYSAVNLLSLEWRIPAGGKVVGLPVLTAGGDILFLSENRYIYSIDTSGHILKKINTYQKFSGTFNVSPDGTLYIGTGAASLMAVNSAGTIRWSKRFEAQLGKNVLVGPGGEIYLLLDNGVLYSMTAGGMRRWRHETGILSDLPIGMDAQGRIIIAGNDGFIHALLPWGREVWKFRLAGTPVVFSFFNGKVLCSTSAGTLVMIHESGILEWQITPGEICTDIVHDGRTIYYATRAGSLYALDPPGEILWDTVLDGEGHRLYLAGGGNLLAASESGFLQLVGPNGEKYGSIDLGTTLNCGLITDDGSFLSGGDDWIVYGFKSSGSPPEGWPQYGGGKDRGWSVLSARGWEYWLKYFENDPDYLATGAYISHGLDNRDPDSLSHALGALDETLDRDDVYFREPYIMFLLKRILLQHINEPTRLPPLKDYPDIRIKALSLLRKIDSSYDNEIYLELIKNEWNDAVLFSVFDNIASKPADRGGALAEETARWVLNNDIRSNRLTGAALEALASMILYRGGSPGRAVNDAVLKIYRESTQPSLRRRAIGLMKY